MKKSSFIALIMGTVSGVLFALGMCMALLPEWNAFTEGILFGAVGMVLSIITVLIWCRMENKKLPKMSGKNLFRIIYAVIAALVLGINLIGGKNVNMAKSKIVKANEKIAGAVTGGYKKMEKGVVGAYTKLEDKFVAAYLTKEGETVEQAKARLKKENK